MHIVKYGAYMDEDETANPDNEVDIIARINRGLADQASSDPQSPRLHGFVLEGSSPYGLGGMAQHRALEVAAFSGMPVAGWAAPTPATGAQRLGRRDHRGQHLDTNKARLLLMAAMLKLGRLPKARDPRSPTRAERAATVAAVERFQEIFENH